jgi:hypothetical protein
MTFTLPRVGIHAIKTKRAETRFNGVPALTLIEPLGGYDVCC